MESEWEKMARLKKQLDSWLHYIWSTSHRFAQRKRHGLIILDFLSIRPTPSFIYLPRLQELSLLNKWQAEGVWYLDAGIYARLRSGD